MCKYELSMCECVLTLTEQQQQQVKQEVYI